MGPSMPQTGGSLLESPHGATPGAPSPACGVCRLHGDPDARQRWQIGGDDLWLLRHHPDPAPLAGWLLLDSARHLGGPVDFTSAEAAAWGRAVQAVSRLVRQEASEAWAVADLYRAVADERRPAADPAAVEALVQRARTLWKNQGWDLASNHESNHPDFHWL